jgi:hypothetical protein
VRQAQVAVPHGASVDCPCCCQHDGNVALTNSKRPALLLCHVVNDIGTDGDVPVFFMEQYPNFNFVGTEAVQELGINSGGSNEAQINDPGYEESFVLLDDDDSNDCLPNAKVNQGYDVEAPISSAYSTNVVAICGSANLKGRVLPSQRTYCIPQDDGSRYAIQR